MKKQVSIIDRYDRALIGQEDRTIQQVNSILSSSYDQIEKKLRGNWDSNPNLIPTQRQLLLADQIKDLYPFIDPLQAKEAKKSFKSLLASSSENGQKLGDELLRVSAPKNEYDAFTKKTAQLPIEALTQLAEKAVDNLKRYSDEFKQSIINTVGFHLSIGSGISKTASSLRMALGITQSKAEMLARTESLSALNNATKQHYQENELELFQYIATQDTRLCPYCAYRNMKVFKLGESQPPIHPRCRCCLVPYKKEWEDLGLIDRAESDKFYENGLKQLGDKKPNSGQSPFERLNNQPAPKPFIYQKPLLKPKNSDEVEIKIAKDVSAKVLGRQTTTKAELFAIGRKDANDLDDLDVVNLNLVRNSFNSREDFLNATPKEFAKRYAKDFPDSDPMVVMYSGRRVSMSAEIKFDDDNVPEFMVEFEVDGTYDKDETESAIPKPTRELIGMTRAYEEWEKSKSSTGLLSNIPYGEDGFGEARAKMYKKFGFKNAGVQQIKNNTKGKFTDSQLADRFYLEIDNDE